MKETTNIQTCTRAGDSLIAYLYNEASEIEAKDFERHLRQCASCHAELSAFREVRESVGMWREEALGASPLPATTMSHAPVFEVVRTTPARSRSVFTSLREFFNVSPVWMRAATAFATIVVCALVVMAVLRFVKQSEPDVADRQPQKVEQEQTTVPQVANLPAEDNAQRVNNLPTPQPAVVPAKDNKTVRKPRLVKRPNENYVASQRAPKRESRAPVLTEQEKKQLANIFIASNPNDEDEEVPRLIDLLGASN